MSWGKVKIDPADRLFSIYVRLRDGCCQRCRYPGGGRLGIDGLQLSHFCGRRSEATRFNELNCCALCSGCHARLTQFPAEHYAFQVKRLGQEVVDRLVIMSNSYMRRDRKGQKLYWSLRLKAEYPDVKI